MSVVIKIISLIEYHGVLQYSDSVPLLSRIVQVALNTHSQPIPHPLCTWYFIYMHPIPSIYIVLRLGQKTTTKRLIQTVEAKDADYHK